MENTNNDNKYIIMNDKNDIKHGIGNFRSLEGKILVASPHMDDKNFQHALIYICAHDENGAIGMIINRKIGDVNINNFVRDHSTKNTKKNIIQKNIEFIDTKIKLEKDDEDIKNTNTKDNKNNKNKNNNKNKIPIMLGGPVNSENTIIISINKYQIASFDKHKNINIYSEIPKFIKHYTENKIKPHKIMLIKGVSLWDSSQLEEEIAENNWFVINASIDIIFSQKTQNTWQKVIEKLGIDKINYFVNYLGNA